jgi:uncharacterized protein YbjT (DUF2867 family)
LNVGINFVPVDGNWEMKMTTNDRTVLVFGATGQQGGSVATAMRAAGWDVRAFVRDTKSAKAQALAAAGCQLAQGDLGDPGAIEAAMAGVYGVFSVQPSSGQGDAYGISDAQEIAYAKTIADAALAAGVRHFIYSSINAAGNTPTGMGHFDSKIEVEKYLASLPMPITVVRPSAFMEILMLPGLGLDQGSLTFFMRPDQAMQFIAAVDIGCIVAAIFALPEHYVGRTIEIAGDSVTGSAMAAKLSAAAGHEIGYQRFPDIVLADNAFLRGLAALVDDGRLAGNADLDGLRALVPGLYTFDSWLAGPGKTSLETALQVGANGVSLR